MSSPDAVSSLSGLTSKQVTADQLEPVCTTNKPEPVRQPQPFLKLTCIDHHFAPGAETLRATYETRDLSPYTVTLRIYARDNALVFEQDPAANTDGNAHPVGLAGWQGQGNQGVYAGKLITPLDSPYRIKVEAAGAGLSDEATFRV